MHHSLIDQNSPSQGAAGFSSTAFNRRWDEISVSKQKDNKDRHLPFASLDANVSSGPGASIRP
jgi:hypothetical protein